MSFYTKKEDLSYYTNNVDNFFGRDSNLLDNYFVDDRFPKSNEIVQSKKFQPEYTPNNLNSGSSRVPKPDVPPGLYNYQPRLNSPTMSQNVQADPKYSWHSERSKDVFKHPDQISSDYQFMVELRRFLKHHSTVMNISYNSILPKHFIEYLELVDNMGPLSSKSSIDNYCSTLDCQYSYESITGDRNPNDLPVTQSKTDSCVNSKDLSILQKKYKDFDRRSRVSQRSDSKRSYSKELVEKNQIDCDKNTKTFSSDSNSNEMSNQLQRKANKKIDKSESNMIHKSESKPSTEVFEYNLEEAMSKNSYLDGNETSDNSNSIDSSDESKVSEIKEDSYIDYSEFSDSICIGISDNKSSCYERRDVMNKVNIILRNCNLPALGSNVYRCFLIPKRGISKQWVRPLVYLTFNNNKEAKESFDKISSYISKIKVYIDKPTVKFSNKFIDNHKGRKTNGKK